MKKERIIDGRGGWLTGWKDEWMDEWIDGWIDGSMGHGEKKIDEWEEE